MGDTYLIRADTFRATLRKDRLTDISRPQFRKLLRLASTYPENQPMLEDMCTDICRQVAKAKTALEVAERDYRANWKHVARPRSRKPEIRRIMEENRRLKTAVRKARGYYHNWVSIQAHFEKECF